MFGRVAIFSQEGDKKNVSFLHLKCNKILPNHQYKKEVIFLGVLTDQKHLSFENNLHLMYHLLMIAFDLVLRLIMSWILG